MTANIVYHRLRNGKWAAIRPARLEDARLIWEMHQRLSSTSVYKRYHRHYEPSLEALEQVCRITEDAGAVFVAAIDDPGEVVIGMAYYLIEEDGIAAEPALLVEDRFQGMGLGRQLGNHLGQHAVEQGIRTFTAYLLPGNDAVMRIIKRGGQDYQSFFSHGTKEIHINLSPPELIPVEHAPKSTPIALSITPAAIKELIPVEYAEPESSIETYWEIFTTMLAVP